MTVLLPAALAQVVSTSPVDLQLVAYELYVLIAASAGDVTGPGVAVNNDIAVFDGITGKLLKDGGQTIAQVLSAAGDVDGPAGATANNLAVFDGATGKLIKDGGAVPAGGDVQASKVKLTGGNFTTSSATFVDVTGATITITTGAHRCWIMVSMCGSNNNAGFQTCGVTLLIDGVNQAGTVGITSAAMNLSNQMNLSFSFVTDVLSAGAHTFKLQAQTSGGTFSINASTVIPLIFSVVETGLTT